MGRFMCTLCFSSPSHPLIYKEIFIHNVYMYTYLILKPLRLSYKTHTTVQRFWCNTFIFEWNEYFYWAHIKVIKNNSLTLTLTQTLTLLHCYTRFLFQISTVLLNLEKLHHVSSNILNCTTVLNIDNDKKSFLCTKSAYEDDFWRIMWHWSFATIGMNYMWK